MDRYHVTYDVGDGFDGGDSDSDLDSVQRCFELSQSPPRSDLTSVVQSFFEETSEGSTSNEYFNSLLRGPTQSEGSTSDEYFNSLLRGPTQSEGSTGDEYFNSLLRGPTQQARPFPSHDATNDNSGYSDWSFSSPNSGFAQKGSNSGNHHRGFPTPHSGHAKRGPSTPNSRYHSSPHSGHTQMGHSSPQARSFKRGPSTPNSRYHSRAPCTPNSGFSSRGASSHTPWSQRHTPHSARFEGDDSDGPSSKPKYDRRIVVTRVSDERDLVVTVENENVTSSKDSDEGRSPTKHHRGKKHSSHSLKQIASMYHDSADDDDDDDVGDVTGSGLRSVVVKPRGSEDYMMSAETGNVLSPSEMRIKAQREKAAKLEKIQRGKKTEEEEDRRKLSKEECKQKAQDLRKQLEIKRLQERIQETDSAIVDKNSLIGRIKKQRVEGDDLIGQDKDMLQKRVETRTLDTAALEKDAQFLRLRRKADVTSSPRLDKDDDVIRLREKVSSGAGATTSATATSAADEEKILAIRAKEGAGAGSKKRNIRARVPESESDEEVDGTATSRADEKKILAIREMNQSSRGGSPYSDTSENTEIAMLRNKLSATDNELKKLQKKKSGGSKVNVGEDDMSNDDAEIIKKRSSAPESVILEIRKNNSSSSLDRMAAVNVDSKFLSMRAKNQNRKQGSDDDSDDDDDTMSAKRKPKQRLALGGASGVHGAKKHKGKGAAAQSNKTRYELEMGEGKSEDKAARKKALQDNMKKVANMWKTSDSPKAEKDHTDPNLSYQERLDALRGKCSHLYRKPGGAIASGLSGVNWKSGNWKAKFQSLYGDLKTPFIDTHCHIDFLFQRTWFRGSFGDYLDANPDTVPPNFAGCVAVFCEPGTYHSDKKLFQDLMDEELIHGAVGVHPKSASAYDDRIEKRMRVMLSHEKVCALGEIGLDYSGTFHKEKGIQKRVFRRQLQLAEELDLPIVIHCRDAEEDCIQVLESTIDRNHTIHRHCWTGSWEECEIWMDKFPNSFVGLTPLITQGSGRAEGVREVAARIPLEKLLLETDSPYFIPGMIPKESMKFSHPALAITVASEVAALQDVDIETVLEHARRNTYKMYGINAKI